MSELTTIEPQRRQLNLVEDAVPILDTARFEHMQRIANVMARSSLIPETLCTFGTKDKKQDLPFEQVLSNCFLVVNQAVRWGLDPFAVAQSVSVVHGKLCYEGKLVSAVLEAKLGLRLYHHFTGQTIEETYRVFVSDREFDDDTIAALQPGFRKSGWRLFDGSVADWKTTGAGTPWTPKNYTRMLIYRGARDWCRIYEPALMLGIYTPDEMLDLSENPRASRSRDITPQRPSLADRLLTAASQKAGAQEGFTRATAGPEVAGEAGPSSADRGVTAEAGPVENQGSATPDADEFPGDTQIAEGEDTDEVAPRFDPPVRDKVAGYVREMLMHAAGSDPADKRRNRVKISSECWANDLKVLPDAARGIARQAIQGARDIIDEKDGADLSSAITHFAYEIGVEEAALQPAAE